MWKIIIFIDSQNVIMFDMVLFYICNSEWDWSIIKVPGILYKLVYVSSPTCISKELTAKNIAMKIPQCVKVVSTTLIIEFCLWGFGHAAGLAANSAYRGIFLMTLKENIQWFNNL